jgi:ABC-type branched-subunit amino acid transport system substrate-binding protein
MFVGFVLALGMSVVQATPRDPIIVAGLFDLTGGGAIWGQSERNAFLLACREFEAKNPDIKVSSLVEDTMFSSKQTVTALQKLTSINKIKFIIGATWETTVPMLPICEAKKVVCISPSYHGKEYYTRPHRYSFTAWFDDRGYTTALVRQMNERGYRKVAIFSAITPYYDSLVDNFLPQSRAEIVTNERMVLEERDFRALITKTPSDVEAVLMLLDNAGQIQAFLKQWSELRRDRPAIYTDDLIAYLDPPEDVKRYGFPIYRSAPDLDPDRSRAFAARYDAEFKKAPEGSSAAVAYDETMLLLECIKRDGDVEAVRSCIASTERYDGFSGVFSFNGGQTVTDRSISVKEF